MRPRLASELPAGASIGFFCRRPCFRSWPLPHGDARWRSTRAIEIWLCCNARLLEGMSLLKPGGRWFYDQLAASIPVKTGTGHGLPGGTQLEQRSNFSSGPRRGGDASTRVLQAPG